MLKTQSIHWCQAVSCYDTICGCAHCLLATNMIRRLC